MGKYGIYGKLTAKQGKREELVGILLQASGLVRNAKGCHHYIVNKDVRDENAVWVNEIWDSKADHDNSLKLPGVAELIALAMPLIEGPPVQVFLDVVGGKGVER